MKKYIRLRRWLIVLLILLIITFYYKDILGDIVTEIRKLPASMTIISILFTVIYFVMEGKLIQFVAVRHVRGFSWSQGTAIAYISSFYKFLTMGAAAGPAEVFYLYRENIPISKATGMCLVKYIIHRITIVVYGIVSYLLLPQSMKRILEPYRIYIIIGSLITVVYTSVLIGICTSKLFSKFVIWLLRKIPIKKAGHKKKLTGLIDSIILLQEESTILFNDKKKIIWIFTLNIGKQTSCYLIPAILLYNRSNMKMLYVIALMAVCNMLAGVLPAPSGIGSLEFVFLKLFQYFIAGSIAGSVILMYRFVTWMVPFAVGGIYVAFYRRHADGYNPVT